MIKTVIIEDERPAARRLQRMLNSNNIHVDATLHSVEESIQYFQHNRHPDVIFLDIQLSDGLSFEIFDAVEVKSACIFTTAYDEYALKAFKLNSVDYLLKPIDEEELETAISKFNENRASGFDINKLKDFLHQASKPEYKTRFSIQVGQYLKVVETNEITCFYSENKGSFLSTTAGRSYSVDTSLEALEKELDPAKFFRISRNAIINYQAIKEIINYTNSRLQIKLENFDEISLIVSREKVKDFKQWLG